MEASPLTQQSRPTSFTPKIVQLYDDLLKISEEDATFSDGFWREFFLLKPDKTKLQQKLDALSANDLLHLQHETQQLFSRAILDVREGVEPMDEHALDTLTVFLGVILSKRYTNPSSDAITIIAGLDEVDSVMSEFANAIEASMKNAKSVETRKKALGTALALTAGAYQTSLVSYFSYRDLFPAIVKYIQELDDKEQESHAFLLLGLLANYNKFEFRNPYRARFEDFVNEAIILKIVQGLGASCTISRNRFVAIQEDVAAGWSLSAALSYIGLGIIAPAKQGLPAPPQKTDDNQVDFSALPDSGAAVLLATFDFAAANKVFCFSLVNCVEAPKGHEVPFAAFLSLTSYILHHAFRSPRATTYGLLNLLTLRILIEDLALCKVLCDAERPLTVRLCRQRQPFLPATPKPRPSAAAILDILIDTINHNLRRNLDIQLYIASMGTIHRLLSYLAFTRTRLNYHWPLLWQTLLSFLRFLTAYSSTFNDSLGFDSVIRPLLASLALAVLSGESFLPSTAVYDDLFYKLVEAGDQLNKFKSLFSKHLATDTDAMGTPTSTPQPKGSDRTPIDVLTTVSSHYYELVEMEKGKGRVGKNPSPREVSKVIKQGYESLSLPGMDGLDRWDRFREGDERGLLKRAARFAVEDTRQMLKTS